MEDEAWWCCVGGWLGERGWASQGSHHIHCALLNGKVRPRDTLALRGEMKRHPCTQR